MKLNERMRYPHPVLSDYSSDYVSSQFSADFLQNLTTDDELRIEANIKLDCKPLLDLIENQKAAIGYFVICRPTYFNTLQPVAPGLSEKYFDAKRLFGTVQLRPVVWTLVHIKDFKSNLFDKEFGDSVPIAKGSIIALGPEFRFSIDRKKYKPFDSIFELAKSEEVKEGTFAVDHASDRIRIMAASKTYDAISGMRNIVPHGRNMLLNGVYLPAVVEIINRMQTKEKMDCYKWYRIFQARCDDLGIEPTNDKQSALEMAQMIMRHPLGRLVKTAETI